MSKIQIANLQPTGSELFQGSESFLSELQPTAAHAIFGGKGKGKSGSKNKSGRNKKSGSKNKSGSNKKSGSGNSNAHSPFYCY